MESGNLKHFPILSTSSTKYSVDQKSKGKEKKENTHLNAEFQKIARTNKTAFLSEQRKETEENNRMGKIRDLFKKIRDLFKKIRDTKGTFHAKMGPIKEEIVWT